MIKMKYSLFVILAVALFVSCKKDSPHTIPPDGIWDVSDVDTPPEFPEGKIAFFNFIGRNVRYPQDAIQNKIGGKVEVSFVVETDGTLGNIHALTNVGGGLEGEAVRALSLSPKWNPGIKNNQPVRVRVQFPIVFNIP